MSPVGLTYDERLSSDECLQRSDCRDIAREVVAGDVGAGGHSLGVPGGRGGRLPSWDSVPQRSGEAIEQ